MSIELCFGISGKSRDEIYDLLKKNNIHARKYFYPLCSNYDFYSGLESANKNNLAIANKISNQVLCLPFYGELADSDVKRIADLILAKN